MATKPLQDDPSGPDTEYSADENVEEPLVLRTAKNLILPLQIPDQWEEQPLLPPTVERSSDVSPVLAFNATTQILDQRTQRFHKVRLSVKPGVAEAIRVSKPYKLVSREVKSEDSIIHVRGVPVGGPELVFCGGVLEPAAGLALLTASPVTIVGARG